MFETKTKHSRSWLYTIIGLLLVVALLASIFPASVQAEEGKEKEKVECKARHTVRSNDTLAKIATKYGVYVQAIVAANHMVSPYTIYVGQSMCIPAKNTKDPKVPKYAKNLAANYFAYVKNDKLFIQATNFPKSTVYYVKVKGDVFPGTVQNKIGLLNTSGRSNFTDGFKLPRFIALQRCSWCA